MLTDSAALQHKITAPQFEVSKTYWTQVEGAPNERELLPLREGVELKDGVARPARVRPRASRWAPWSSAA